jgi:hypothetical protein
MRRSAEDLLKSPPSGSLTTLDLALARALSALRTIQLANFQVELRTIWPNRSPDCSWLDSQRTPPSGWIENQWYKYIYYQIDQTNLVREASGTPAPGGLTINGRGAHQLVVIAPGRALAAQSRNLLEPSEFFEGANAHPSRKNPALAPVKQFESRPVSPNFNDQLSF